MREITVTKSVNADDSPGETAASFGKKAGSASFAVS